MQSGGTWKVWRMSMIAVMAPDPTTQPCRRQGSACTWWWPVLSPSCHDSHWLLLGKFGYRGTGTASHSARFYRNYKEPCNVRVIFLTSSNYVFFQAPSPRRTTERLKIWTQADTANFQLKPFHHSRYHSTCITYQKTKTLLKYHI